MADLGQIVIDAQHRPLSYLRGLLTTVPVVLAIPAGATRVKLTASVLAWAGVSASSAAPAAPTAEVQRITAGDAAGGTALYSFRGQQTIATAWNASAATFQTNLRALSSIGSSGVTCSGGTLDAVPVTATFAAAVLAGDLPLITVDGASLTGGVNLGSMTPVVTEITPGATAPLGHLEAAIEETWNLTTTDAYLSIAADTGTGTWRVSFYG